MQQYRCYFLGQGNSIVAVEIMECADDRAAVAKARELMAQRGHGSGIEVWLRDRRVYASRSDSAPD